MHKRRHLLTVVATAYFALMVALTFTQGSAVARESWIIPTLLFMPVGFLLTLLMGRRRWWVAVGFGMLGSAWVEAAQTIWMPPGYASVADILCGIVGSSLGVALGVGLLTIRYKSMHSHGLPRVVTHAGK